MISANPGTRAGIPGTPGTPVETPAGIPETRGTRAGTHETRGIRGVSQGGILVIPVTQAESRVAIPPVTHGIRDDGGARIHE